jgi:hypothetical protein
LSTRGTAGIARVPIGQLSLLERPPEEVGTSANPKRAQADRAGRLAGLDTCEKPTLFAPAVERHSWGRRSLGGAIAGDGSRPPLAADPLAVALAQLVRDCWAADQADGTAPVALENVASIMATVAPQLSTVEAAPA